MMNQTFQSIYCQERPSPARCLTISLVTKACGIILPLGRGSPCVLERCLSINAILSIKFIIRPVWVRWEAPSPNQSLGTNGCWFWGVGKANMRVLSCCSQAVESLQSITIQFRCRFAPIDVAQNVLRCNFLNRSLNQMDRLLQQKKKSEANFRLKINDFVSKSQYARKRNQITPNVLHDILTSTPLFDGVVTNGKVNVEKLCEKVTASDPHCNPKDLLKVMGGKKQMKVNQLQLLLKSYQLHEFDLEEEIAHLLFQGNSLSLKKLEGVMSSLAMPVLTPKDRQLLVECFDFDHDGDVGQQDLKELMGLCKIRGQEQKLTQFK